MQTIARRQFLRTGLLAAAAVMLPGILAACGRGRAPTRPRSLRELLDSRIDAGAQRGLSVFLGGEDYVPGAPAYLAFGLVRDQVGPVMGSAASIWLAPTAGDAVETVLTGPLSAPWQGYTKPDAGPPAPQGINAIEARFDRAGIWTLVAEVESGGTRYVGTAAVQVKDTSSTKLPGQKPIASQTPTVDDRRGVEPICTRTPPCEFHRVTLAKALTLGKPVAFIVATPRFCMSRTCGPNLEELILVANEVGDRATFVHAEVYKDDEDAPAKNLVSPTFAEWGFQSEPWLFLIGGDGTIASRFEGPLTAPVIRSKLAPLLA